MMAANNGFTVQRKQQPRQLRLCFGCNQPGHVQRECPFKIRIFVGRLLETTSESEIRSHFMRFGDLHRLDLIYMKSGQRKRFCFLEFREPMAARHCLANRIQQIGPCYIVVDKASPRGSENETRREYAKPAGKSGQQHSVSTDVHQFRQYAIKINRNIRMQEPQTKVSREISSQTDAVIVEKVSREMETQTDKSTVEKVSIEIGTQTDQILVEEKETATVEISVCSFGTQTSDNDMDTVLDKLRAQIKDLETKLQDSKSNCSVCCKDYNQVYVEQMTTALPQLEIFRKDAAIERAYSECREKQFRFTPKIQVFTGEPGGFSLENFIREAKRVIVNHKLAAYIDTEFVHMHLGEKPRRVVESHPYDESCTPSAIFNILRKSFGAPPVQTNKPPKKSRRNQQSRW